MTTRTYYDVTRGRRSTRLFADRPVPGDVIERIVAAAVEAPTACNRQLWHFVAVTDKALKDRISRLSRAQQSYLHDAPVVLAVFYDCSLESRNPCKTPYISAGMAMYAILLAAESEGLGSIYLGGIRCPKGVSEALDAPPHATNLGVICLGYKDDAPPTPPHRAVNEILSFDAYEPRAKHYPADIRPHLWSLRQVADFRDKLLWYKGIGIDGKTLHVDPEPRFCAKTHYTTGRLGMLIQHHAPAKVLDVLSFGGDIVQQCLNACGPELQTLYAYDLTPGICRYVRTRLQDRCDLSRLSCLVNDNPDAVAIPLPDESVDIVFCGERLEHFEDPGPLLAEMRRVVSPKGRILLTVSNRFYPHMYRYRRMRRKHYSLGRNWNRGPERKYEPGKLKRHFEDAGLTIDDVTGFHPITRPLASGLGRIAGRLRLTGVARRCAEYRTATRTTTTWLRNFSSLLIYELTRR